MMFQDVELVASDYLQESFEEQKVASFPSSPHTTPSKTPKKHKSYSKVTSDSKANPKISKIAYKPFKKRGINALSISTIGYILHHLAVTANIGKYVNEVLYTLNKN
jgi:hypothetical protein